MKISDRLALYAVGAVLFLFIAGLISLSWAWPPKESLVRNKEITVALEGVGFTPKQVNFLRHGPVGAQSCLASGFSEKTCSFLLAHPKERMSDAERDAGCHDASLTKDQCTILRVGVDRFRRG